VFDTSRESVAEETGLAEEQPDREYGPLTVEIGSGRVIEGIEGALVGQEEGATPTVAVPPEKGYGEWTEDRVEEYDREEFIQMVGGQIPEEGAYLETEDGGLAEVVHVDDEVVQVDFNHSLAGETLEFDIEIVDVA
jgi:FKBP-type peptidyl-prolyl cis-trans isomerase 2